MQGSYCQLITLNVYNFFRGSGSLRWAFEVLHRLYVMSMQRTLLLLVHKQLYRAETHLSNRARDKEVNDA